MASFQRIHIAFTILCLWFTAGLAVWNGCVFLEVRSGLYPFIVMVAAMVLPLLGYRLARIWAWKDLDQ